jgi:hypothetical protein
MFIRIGRRSGAPRFCSSYYHIILRRRAHARWFAQYGHAPTVNADVEVFAF